jgi:ABC-type nitrate/sulfonate/bicarbonate transport system ATPase subunit
MIFETQSKLLLDEPISSLDRPHRVETWHFLKEVMHLFHIPVVLVIHAFEEAVAVVCEIKNYHAFVACYALCSSKVDLLTEAHVERKKKFQVRSKVWVQDEEGASFQFK